MKKYVLTSGSFSGTVIFGYEDEMLTFFHNEGEMDTVQKAWCARNLPAEEKHLEQLKKIVKGTIEELPERLDFDAFWDAYGKKINKARCVPLWKKLSDADRYECLRSIKSYEGCLKRTGRGKLDPENYIKNQGWTTNWNQV